MYYFNSRIRYSEVNSEKKLTLPALMDYLQDCCTFQSEELGVGVNYLEENQRAWVLSSWEIVIERYPKLAEKVSVGTWAYDFKGFYGYRNFIIKDEQENALAFANSIWVYMDTEKMRPVKISEHMAEVYVPTMEPMLEYEWSSRKIKVAAGGLKKEPIAVQKFHIDTNHHMNNGKYILLAEEYLPENFETQSVRVEYKKAAMLGDILYPEISSEENAITVTFADEEEKPYAVISFKRKGLC